MSRATSTGFLAGCLPWLLGCSKYWNLRFFCLENLEFVVSDPRSKLYEAYAEGVSLPYEII